MPMIGVLGVVALVALVGRYGERLSRRGITVTGIAVTVLDCTNPNADLFPVTRTH